MTTKTAVPSSSLGESITGSFSTMINCLETLTKTVKQQSAQFKQLTDSLGEIKLPPTEPCRESTQEVTDNSAQTVHLNVGGTVFVTNKETLTRQEKDSFFSAMINGDWKPDFNDGKEFFIDRSPQAFSLILDYMRADNPQDIVGGWTPNEVSMVAREAAFFQLDRLQAKIQESGATGIPQGFRLLNDKPLLCWDDNIAMKGEGQDFWQFSHNNTWVSLVPQRTQVCLWGKLTTNRVVTHFRIFAKQPLAIGFGIPGFAVTMPFGNLTSFVTFDCRWDPATNQLSVTRSDTKVTTTEAGKAGFMGATPLPLVEMSTYGANLGIMGVQ